MKREKEICFVRSYSFKWNFYVSLEDFKNLMAKHIELRSDNERLSKELEKKKNVIKYYRKEKKRLSDLVDKLHVDCVYYENHWQPKPWEIKEEQCPF